MAVCDLNQLRCRIWQSLFNHRYNRLLIAIEYPFVWPFFTAKWDYSCTINFIFMINRRDNWTKVPCFYWVVEARRMCRDKKLRLYEIQYFLEL